MARARAQEKIERFLGRGRRRRRGDRGMGGSNFTNHPSRRISFAMKKEGAKHHYLPRFYLKQWTNSDGELCEFRHEFKIVRHRMTSTKGTGYVRGLYTFDGLPPEAADFLEAKFFMQADAHASVALDQLLAHKVDLIEPYKSAWSRFIMTLIYRNPEAIARLRHLVIDGLPKELEQSRSVWEATQSNTGPLDFDDYKEAFSDRNSQRVTLMFLRMVMDGEKVGQLLNSMAWAVLTFNRVRYSLLTSDRPYVMTNGIGNEDGHIVLPISPRTIFIAARNQRTMRQILDLCNDESLRMDEKLNNIVARQSHRFVYSTNADQLLRC